VHWVLALRNEFFGDLATFRPRIRNPFDNDYRLNCLTPQEARAVITEPAEQSQLQVEPALVDAILLDLQQPDGQIAPPQVQSVCQAEDKHRPHTITLALYEQEERARRILGRYLYRVLSRTLRSQEEQELARRLRLSHSELSKRLATALIATTSLNAVLKDLVDTHLLIAEKEDIPIGCAGQFGTEAATAS
jgi:hypothetical protein